MADRPASPAPASPFSTGVLSTEWVLGRDAELAVLRKALRTNLVGVVVRGPRGIGKTALVERFRADCHAEANFVFLDVRDYVEPIESGNLTAAVYRIINGIVEELNFSGLLPPGAITQQVSDGYFFRELLVRLSQPTDPRLVVVLDELDHLDAAVIRALWRRFFSVRHLPRPPMFVGILGESWGGGADVFQDRDERIQPVALGPLDVAGVGALLERHATLGAFGFADGAAEALSGETGGYPLFIVALLDALYELRARETLTGHATAAQIHEAADLSAARMPARVKHAISQMGPAGQRVLASLVDHQALSRVELFQIVEADWKADPTEISATLDGLLRAKVVTASGGVLQAPIPMLVAWIKRLTVDEIEAAERPPTTEAFAAYRDAERLEFEGQRDAAIERLTTAITVDPRYWRARWLLGRLLVARAETTSPPDAIDMTDAEAQLEEAHEQVPKRGGAAAHIERLLMRVLVAHAKRLDAGDRRRLVIRARIADLDPFLTDSSARGVVADIDVYQWASELAAIPAERWADRTRRLLLHDRCWQPAAVWLAEQLALALRLPRNLPRLRELIRGAAGPLLEIERPGGAEDSSTSSTGRPATDQEVAAPFCTMVTDALIALARAFAPEPTGFSATLWGLTLSCAPERRRAELLTDCTPLLQLDLEAMLLEPSTSEPAELVRLINQYRAVDTLQSLVNAASTLVLDRVGQAERLAPLHESLGPLLASFASARDLPTMLQSAASDLATLFFEADPSTDTVAVTPEAAAAWRQLAGAAPGMTSIAEYFDRLRKKSSRAASELDRDLELSEKEQLESLLDGMCAIEERVPLRIPGLATPIAQQTVRVYRGRTLDPERPDRMVRVFHLRGENPDLRAVLRSTWDIERRVLATISLTTGGRALTRYHDARYDMATDRAVLVTEWPGTTTLRDALAGPRMGLLAPAARKELWRNLAALLEAVQTLHAARFIHRALSPDVIYLQSERPGTTPRFKLAHFEWSVYLRGLTSMASPLSRELNRYLAPEALRAVLGVAGGLAGEAFGSDLYGLGLILFECLVRPLTSTELSSYQSAGAYDADEQQRHRDWIEHLRDEVAAAARGRAAQSPLMPQERDILFALLQFDLGQRRRGVLEDSARVARLLGTEYSPVRAPLTLVTTLSIKKNKNSDPDFGDDPRDAPRCIAKYLRNVMPEIAMVPADDRAAVQKKLSPSALRSLLIEELKGAHVHVNVRTKQPFLLMLVSKSGIQFRVRPLEWDADGEFIRTPDARIGFLEVARKADRPMEPPIARLEHGVEIIDVDDDTVTRRQRDFRPDLHGSWMPLFELALTAETSLLERSAGEQKRRVLRDVLSLTHRLEREIVSRDLEYVFDSEIESPPEGHKKSVIRAAVEGVDIAERVAHLSDEDPHFEVCSPRESRGTAVVLTQANCDFESETITLPLPASRVPPRGVIRPMAAIGTEVMFNRRRRVLSVVNADDFLLDVLAAPNEHVQRRDRVAARQKNPIIGDIDGDKREIAQRFFETDPLLVVQGPPATGKTTLASEIVLRTLDRLPHGRILITTQGHEPLDNLLERIVAERHINARAKKILGDAEIARIPSGARKREGTAAAYHPHVRAEQLFQQIQDWCRHERESLGVVGSIARSTEARLEGYMSAPLSLRRRVEASANVVFATINSKHVIGPEADTDRYDLVIIEEAARCYPVEIVGAMRLARRWLLIGDHHQLPPFGFTEIQTAFDQFVEEALKHDEASPFKRHAHDAWLDGVQAEFYRYLHLFKHVHEQDVERSRQSATLKTQWRMHPALGDMVSHAFYGGHTVCNPKGEERAALTARRTHQFSEPEWIRGRQIVWIETDRSAECQERSDRSGLIQNEAERRTLVGCLRLFRSPRSTKDVAILTPYRRQAELTTGLLREGINWFDAFAALDDRVFTVDSFQGRQAATVFVSLVRNNQKPDIRSALGFLADPRRATVMFSRAERLLVVIGCADHFSQFETSGAPWVAELLGRAERVGWREVVPVRERFKVSEHRG